MRDLVQSAWRRAAVATIAAQPALVYAYALQGSIKELATLWLVPLLAALVATLAALPKLAGASFRYGPRQLLPLAIVSAAGIAAIGAAVAPWLAPVLLVALSSSPSGARASRAGSSAWRSPSPPGWCCCLFPRWSTSAATWR